MPRSQLGLLSLFLTFPPHLHTPAKGTEYSGGTLEGGSPTQSRASILSNKQQQQQPPAAGLHYIKPNRKPNPFDSSTHSHPLFPLLPLPLPWFLIPLITVAAVPFSTAITRWTGDIICFYFPSQKPLVYTYNRERAAARVTFRFEPA